jgi:hypothetical protein
MCHLLSFLLEFGGVHFLKAFKSCPSRGYINPSGASYWHLPVIISFHLFLLKTPYQYLLETSFHNMPLLDNIMMILYSFMETGLKMR